MRTIAIFAGAITVGVLAWTMPVPAKAQEQAQSDKPGVVMADLAVLPATVEEVDQAQRTVTLRGPEGRLVTLKVDDSVRNFDQIAKGDQVRAEFYEETAIFVRTAEGPPAAGQVGVVGLAPKGEKPGVVGVETTEITARVEAVDLANRMVTLRGPQGNSRTLKVGDQVQKLDQVKVGDEVVIRHTQAVAIGVSKQ